jgi:hypothetical protein
MRPTARERCRKLGNLRTRPTEDEIRIWAEDYLFTKFTEEVQFEVLLPFHPCP